MPLPEKEYRDSERLLPENAHDEANMMRAETRMNPETGLVHPVAHEWQKDAFTNREPTAEDYDNALTALEELKEQALKDQTTMKTLEKIGRLAISPPMLLGSLISRLAHTFSGRNPEIIGASPDMAGRWKESKEETDNAIAFAFADAKSELERLKKKGTEFGTKEVQ